MTIDLADIPEAEAAIPTGRPQLGWLPVSDLYVDTDYQRTLESRASQTLIARIVDEFDWCKFQAITAVPRDDEGWFIVDGQHRTEAARRLGESHVPACVVPKIDQSSQAAIFVAANKQRVSVNQYSLYHARLIAGETAAKAVARVIKAAGLEVPRYPVPLPKMKPGQFLALAVVEFLIRRYGEYRATLAVSVIAHAYRDKPIWLRASLFRGVGDMIGSSDKPEQLASLLGGRLRDINPPDLFGAAQRARIDTGCSEAQGIVRFLDRQKAKPIAEKPSVTVPAPKPPAIVKASPKPAAAPAPKEEKYRPIEPPSAATPALMTDAQRFAKAVRSGGDIRNIAAGFGISVEEAKRRAAALERH